MKVLPFDLDVTTTQRAKGEIVEYITPGAHECKITGITTSDQLDEYKGSPFIQYAVTSNGRMGRCRFWAVKQTDKPSTQEWKKKQMKEFLVNAGVKDFKDDSKAMNDAVGKSLMITFISEEYIGVNRDTQEPVIREATKYRWSAKEGEKCTYNNSMNQILKEVDMKEFRRRHSDWTKANDIVNSNTEIDDSLPFQKDMRNREITNPQRIKRDSMLDILGSFIPKGATLYFFIIFAKWIQFSQQGMFHLPRMVRDGQVST